IHGKELWVSDGTANGTKLLKDIYPGDASSDVSDMTVVRDMLYFSADDGIHGKELWKTDGTDVGTVMIKEVYEGPTGSSPAMLTLHSDTLYYVANHPSYGRELWYIFTNCMAGAIQISDACVNDSIAFADISNTLGETVNYRKWEFGNGDTSSNITQKYAYSQPGVYPIKLTIRSATGCEVITEGEVRVDSFAIARFEINNDTQCLRNNSFRF